MSTDRPIVVSLFDRSANMVRPWAAAGYLCYCVDLQHARGDNMVEPGIRLVGADVHDWLPPPNPVAFFSAAPPCTDVAISGRATFRDKGLGAVIRALQCFKRAVDLAELLQAPYQIENPVSMVSTYWRSPDHVFCYSEFGAPFLKKTCLWTGCGYRLPKKFRGELSDPRRMTHYGKKDKVQVRSETPQSFADAVFAANRPR